MDHRNPSPPAGLQIDGELYRSLLEHLQAAAPHEAVALLAVEPYHPGTLARAVRLYPGTNVHASTTRYTMEPTEVISALDDIDAHDWWLGAIVHSHPATPAAPSATDLREAYYPDTLSIIVSLTTEPPTACAWQIGPRTHVSAVPLLIEQREPETPLSVAG